MTLRIGLWASGLVLAWSLSGCGAAATAQGPGSAVGPGKPGVTTPAGAPVELPETVVSPFSDEQLAFEFERAKSLLLSGKAAEAVEIFDKLIRLAPQGPTAAPSLYNAGICREELGERDAAAARYVELRTQFPDTEIGRAGAFRLLRMFAYLERWQDLSTAADAVLKLTDLTILEKIDGLGAQGLAFVEIDRLEDAEKAIVAARNLIEDHHLGESGKPPIALVQVSFALGELRRLKGEKIQFVPLPANFTDLLEQRCQSLLDAQNAYTEAMRGLDAYWSGMAGYRVGQLYQKLHRDVMAIPPPTQAKTIKDRQLFEGAMRLRYRVLLEKGLKMMDGTVRLGERAGDGAAWVARARDAKKDLELALSAEREALAKMPFTEDEMREALEGLKTKKP